MFRAIACMSCYVPIGPYQLMQWSMHAAVLLKLHGLKQLPLLAMTGPCLLMMACVQIEHMFMQLAIACRSNRSLARWYTVLVGPMPLHKACVLRTQLSANKKSTT